MKVVLDNIRKVYDNKEKIVVLDEFNYVFQPSKIYLIKGASGAGKTTLLSIIGLLDSLTSGQIHFNEQRVDNLSRTEKSEIRKKNISYVFQDFGLMENLTVYENIKLIFCEDDDSTKENKINDFLKRMNIFHRKNQDVKDLSGGEKQRVAFIRALVKEHQILICDEPVSNLDEENSNMVIDLIETIKENRIILISCHTDQFDEICDCTIRV